LRKPVQDQYIGR